MPCNSDYMGLSRREIESKAMCNHVVYLSGKIGKEVPEWIDKGASSYCGAPMDRFNKLAMILCALCQKVPEEYIYDGRNPDARKLADWWDEHQKEDLLRISREEIGRVGKEIKEYERRERHLRESSATRQLTAHEKIELVSLANYITKGYAELHTIKFPKV